MRSRASQACAREPLSSSPNVSVSRTFPPTQTKSLMSIDSLSSADKLENMFLGQSLVWQQVWKHLESVQDGSQSDSRSARQAPSGSMDRPEASLQERIASIGQSLASIGDESTAAIPNPNTNKIFDPPRPLKRPRLDDGTLSSPTSWDPSQPLPDDLVNSLVEVYFERVHPWIPMLHVHRFRQDLANPSKRPGLSTILHAITSCCLRFSDDPRVADGDMRKAASKRSRETVIIQSM